MFAGKVSCGPLVVGSWPSWMDFVRAASHRAMSGYVLVARLLLLLRVITASVVPCDEETQCKDVAFQARDITILGGPQRGTGTQLSAQKFALTLHTPLIQ